MTLSSFWATMKSGLALTSYSLFRKRGPVFRSLIVWPISAIAGWLLRFVAAIRDRFLGRSQPLTRQDLDDFEARFNIQATEAILSVVRNSPNYRIGRVALADEAGLLVPDVTTYLDVRFDLLTSHIEIMVADGRLVDEGDVVSMPILDQIAECVQ